MKYKVIAWDDVGARFPRAKITRSLYAAVLKEIRDNGYMFGGDMHEYYAPVLNDGTQAEWSWRGWGGVMADAYNIDPENKYNYMSWYMDEYSGTRSVYPSAVHGYIEDLVEPTDKIADTHVMHLCDDAFFALREGKKHIEARLFDDARQGIDVCDYIEFRRNGDENDRIPTLVTDLHYDDSFRRMSDRLGAARFGADSTEELLSVLGRFYTADEEKKNGVVGIELSLPTRMCQGDKIELELWGERRSVAVCTDRLPEKSKKPLFELETEAINKFVSKSPFNSPEVIAEVQKYLIKYYNKGCMENEISSVRSPLLNINKLRVCRQVHEHKRVCALSGTIEGDYCGEGISVVYEDGRFVGVGAGSAYRSPYMLYLELMYDN